MKIWNQKSQSKSHSRKWRYVFLIAGALFFLAFWNVYYNPSKRAGLVKRIEAMKGHIYYSRVITGNKKVDEYLLSTDLTAHLVKPFRRVSEIYIESTTVTNKFISEFHVFRKIQTLYLKDNNISDLKYLVGLEKLNILNLGNNQVTDLSSLAGLEKLNILNLDNNQFTDLSHLAGLEKLEYLLLQGNQITDLSPLHGLISLKELTLSDNPNLTIDEINKLQQALPNCKITHNAKK